MKNTIYKFICYLCALALLISMTPGLITHAAAAEVNTGDVVISEYEYITAIRTMSKEKLINSKLTNEEIELIKSDVIEKELLARKEKSDAELMAHYGYDQNEIAILRSYTGERLENNPELAAITGTLTIAKPTVLAATSSRIGVRITWSWDQRPAVCANDVFAVYWSPTFGSSNGNMRINISDSSYTLTFNVYNAGYDISGSFTQVSPNSAAKAQFSMIDQSGDGWAECGSATLYFDATSGSAALTEMDFIFAYGHTVISVSPSVSFPVSGGISFGWNTSEADRRSGYINVSSKTWTDN